MHIPIDDRPKTAKNTFIYAADSRKLPIVHLFGRLGVDNNLVFVLDGFACS